MDDGAKKTSHSRTSSGLSWTSNSGKDTTKPHQQPLMTLLDNRPPQQHPTPPSPTLIHHASYHITHPSIPQKIQTFSSDSKPDVFIDDNEETLTIIPPLPDFDKPPYAKPIGPVFQEPEWTALANHLHDKNVQLLTACVSIATILNLPITTLRPTHLHRNVIELGETVIRQITRS